MKIFNLEIKKDNKENKENKGIGNDIINQLALQEALRELNEERAINEGLLKGIENAEKENKNLTENLNIMINSYDKIKEICNQSKTSKIAKAILKELGE